MEVNITDESNILYKLLQVELDKICRSCLNICDEMTSIYNTITDENETIQIKEVISTLSGIMISSIGYPNQICIPCATRVFHCFQFKMQTLKSDKILQELNSLHSEINNEAGIVIIEPNNKIKQIDEITNDNSKEHKNREHNALMIQEYKEVKSENENKLVDQNIESVSEKSFLKSEIANTSKDTDIERNVKSDPDCKQKPKTSYAKKNNKTTKKEPRSIGCLKKIQDLFENPNEPQNCSVCSQTFANINALIKHRAQAHGPKKYQCHTCGNGFTTTRGLRIHLRLHTGEKPEICSICDKAFSDPRTLRNHEKIHSGEFAFACEYCGKRFPARLPLIYHTRSHTGEKPHKCNFCEKSYVQESSLQIHLRTHTGEKPFVCNICNRGFTNTTSLSLHQLIHNGIKKYQCSICGKRVGRSGELTIHLRTHTGEKPFACEHCDKRFTNSSALHAHMPTHTGIKNFICALCGKRVARAMELRIHMRTHTGERNFKCGFCDKRFSTSSNLRLHERKHTGEKPYACTVCSRRFSDSHILRNHERTHTGERPFECQICGSRFAQLASLKTHTRIHHNKNSETNSKCISKSAISQDEDMKQSMNGIRVIPSSLNNKCETLSRKDAMQISHKNASHNDCSTVHVALTDQSSECLTSDQKEDFTNETPILYDDTDKNILCNDTRNGVYSFAYQE